ncbi:hypothetical protein BJV78DRAFT_1275226 [Lactifluus subvellereus]|nr:hypothetical protein BJV78DRAFT_1275226 [Lactifluus subvellereus]
MQRDQLRGPRPPDSTTNLLLGPLNHLNTVAQQLFQSLSPPHTKPPPPPPITALAEADAALAAAVQLAHVHQKKQQRIEALKADVLTLEDSWCTIIVQLEEGRRDLEAIIAEGDARLDAIEQAKAEPKRVYFRPTNLPDLSLPGQPPPPLFFPPFPNEEKMRRGHLNTEEPLGPLGETHSVGRPPSPPSEPPRGQAANPYRPIDSRPPQQIFDLDLDLNPDL